MILFNTKVYVMDIENTTLLQTTYFIEKKLNKIIGIFPDQVLARLSKMKKTIENKYIFFYNL